MGGVLNLAYKINPNHKLLVRNTLTRDTDKEAREFSRRGQQPGRHHLFRADALD